MLEQINSLMKQAMKDKDQVALTTYRAVKAAITAKNTKGEEPTEDQQIAIVKKMVTSREEVAKVYREQSRIDLAEVEEREAELIRPFIPEPFNEQAATAFIELFVMSKKEEELIKRNMGGFVKEIVSASNSRIDGKLASKLLAPKLK